MTERDPIQTMGLYRCFAPLVVAIETEDNDGKRHIGAGGHLGDGVLVTARHVVEGMQILQIFSREASVSLDSVKIYYPENDDVDLAILTTDFSLSRYMAQKYNYGPDDVLTPPFDHFDLGGHLDDWLDDWFVLQPVVVFGYPPIPTSGDPVLVAARGEVNAIVDPYIGGRHPLFVISPVPRGGFSGGPVILHDSYLLGIVTQALTQADSLIETGFHAVLTIEPIVTLLMDNRIFPTPNRELMYLMAVTDEERAAVPLPDEVKRRLDGDPCSVHR